MDYLKNYFVEIFVGTDELIGNIDCFFYEDKLYLDRNMTKSTDRQLYKKKLHKHIQIFKKTKQIKFTKVLCFNFMITKLYNNTILCMQDDCMALNFFINLEIFIQWLSKSKYFSNECVCANCNQNKLNELNDQYNLNVSVEDIIEYIKNVLI